MRDHLLAEQSAANASIQLPESQHGPIVPGAQRDVHCADSAESEAEEAGRALAAWEAQGIHTKSCKQIVWEIMASRSLKNSDLVQAGFPGVTVVQRRESGNVVAQLRRPSLHVGQVLAPDGRIYARVYRWTGPVNNILESLILTLILANVLAVVIDAITVPKDDDAETTPLQEAFEELELWSTAIFTIEYMMRVWSCTAHPRFGSKGRFKHCTWLAGRFRFMRQPLSVLDLVALIPFYLDILLENGFRLFGNRHQFRGGLVLRVLRLLRVFSLLRLERQLEALQILVQVFRSRSNELLVGDQPASPLVC
jgi:hypothetical protein